MIIEEFYLLLYSMALRTLSLSCLDVFFVAIYHSKFKIPTRKNIFFLKKSLVLVRLFRDGVKFNLNTV